MQTERQAIARLKNGDLAGLEFLVKAYQVQAVQAAYLILRDRGLAEETVQAAFVNAFQKIDQFDQQRPFGPWFYRSVMNAALKTARRQNRLVSLEEDPSGSGPNLIDLLADDRPGPEEWLEAEQNKQAVWQALGRLDPDQRAAIVLHHFLELGEVEIAQKLQQPRSTIKWWLRAGRKRLRSLLHFHRADMEG